MDEFPPDCDMPCAAVPSVSLPVSGSIGGADWTIDTAGVLRIISAGGTFNADVARGHWP